MAEASAQVGTGISLQTGGGFSFGRALSFIRRWPVFSGIVLGVLAFSATLGPVVWPYDYDKGKMTDRFTPPPGFQNIHGETGSWRHPLGTDFIGRDMVSRLMVGGRISLMVVAIAVIFGTVIGVSLGLISGYYGGVLDEILMRLMDIWYGIPFLMVAMIVVVAVGPGVDTMMGLLAMSSFAGFVRVVRAEVLSLRERDYVALAKVAGASTPRILIRHILPGTFSTILVVATMQTGGLILAEAFLSYISAGIPPPTPAWGLMIAQGRAYLQTAWWVTLLPGIAILLTVMAMNFLGDWIRDKLDPRLRQIA